MKLSSREKCVGYRRGDVSVFNSIQEINNGEYLDIPIVFDVEQIAVSTHNIKAFPVDCTGNELIVQESLEEESLC